MTADDKAKEYAEYIAKQIDPFLDDRLDYVDIKKILFKSLKVLIKESKKDGFIEARKLFDTMSPK